MRLGCKPRQGTPPLSINENNENLVRYPSRNKPLTSFTFRNNAEPCEFELTEGVVGERMDLEAVAACLSFDEERQGRVAKSIVFLLLCPSRWCWISWCGRRWCLVDSKNTYQDVDCDC